MCIPLDVSGMRATQYSGTAAQAALGGFAAGTAEYIFEKMGVDSLLDLKHAKNPESWIRRGLKQGGLETGGETLTAVSQLLTDTAIMGENSRFERLVDHYMGEELLTEEEARGRAFLDTLKEVVLAGFGGFLSGSVSGGTTAGLDSRAGTRSQKAQAAAQAEIDLVDFLQGKYNDGTETPWQDDPQNGPEADILTSDALEHLNTGLLTELANSGVKHNPKDIVAIIKTEDKKVIWLEHGTENAGLNHIINEHSKDFQNKGIAQEQIPDYIMAALKNGKIIGYQGKGTGRPIYEFLYNGKLHRVAITVSNNGFVVGANPK